MTDVALDRAEVGSTGDRKRRVGAFAPFPAAAWAYWFALVVPAGLGIGVAAGVVAPSSWTRFATLAVASSVAQMMSVRISSGSRRTFHPAIVFVVAGALMLSPAELVLMCAIQHGPEWVKQRYQWYVQPFNIANYITATLAAWAAAHVTAALLDRPTLSVAATGLAAAAAFVVVNRALLVPMLRLSRGIRLGQSHLLDRDDVALEFVLALMAVPLVALWERSPFVAALSLAPLVLINVTQRATSRLQTASNTISLQNESLEEANRLLIERSTAALEALSATVDARDTYTAGHSRRVRDYSVALGAELGLSDAELETLGQAALLHDIGKIAVPDSVLLKEGALDQLEWLAMKSHPDAGARIIERLGYLDEVVPVIRHHHERPDGHGYPDGLVGEEIPLGARIIHVADALDAMTTQRVYRDARTVEEAMAELRRGAGTDFADSCVEALEQAVAASRLPVPRTRRLREVTAA
jgi:putative nucleotidyltransferase with HDIG domain